MHSVDNATSEFKRAALASAELAAGPTSVDEPTVNVVLGHAFSKHLGIASRLLEMPVSQAYIKKVIEITYVEDNERCTITSRESGDGLEDTIFSSGSFTVQGDYQFKTWEWNEINTYDV